MPNDRFLIKENLCGKKDRLITLECQEKVIEWYHFIGKRLQSDMGIKIISEFQTKKHLRIIGH